MTSPLFLFSPKLLSSQPHPGVSESLFTLGDLWIPVLLGCILSEFLPSIFQFTYYLSDCTWLDFILSTSLFLLQWSSFFFQVSGSVQFSHSVMSDPMDCSTPGLPVHCQLPELAQTHVHWVNDVIQSSHSLLSPSPPVFSLSQHQGLFQWISSSHQVAKGLEFQLQHQSF